ncbi:M48 family metallopeptidase [Parathalassolituus penaei]|uniref:M48 family metallopeptidase n=1 Tax=Parathalassolituus penaei TaxID=2997323 RepID=A0A9X3EDX5_9GAMM|nr:M48 family metallopeptidase [Parathalassolituus penaei]MCY0965774.1 M48 family metallopeptidase [Parathalassolituus penaei]
MDFFNHQDEARKRTGRLVLLFGLAVLGIIVLLNLLVAATLWFTNRHTVEGYQRYVSASGNPGGGMPAAADLWALFNLQQWLTIAAAVLLVIGLVSLFKWVSLRSGGRAVAESLGGRRLTPDSTNPDERRLLNVVEEMAIAAGMPVPPVYVLPDTSINAFAAGYQPSDAVIGVTRGCMQQLDRDQLQGVIAHEFSHILNGDMRLNIRLIAALHGILFIALIGRMLLDGGSRDRKNGQLFMLLGVGMMVLGYIGVFFGNLIKAAVSRQREFLADASAVQFTRNPDSIAGALKVIGYGSGTHISSPQREETAHLFFGEVMRFRFDGFATHPPLEERIRRIQPNWDGRFLPPRPMVEKPQVPAARPAADRQAEALAITATLAGATVSNSTSVGGLPEKLHEMARQTSEARALVLVMLLSKDNNTVLERQLDLILRSNDQLLYRDVLRCLRQPLGLTPRMRLLLVEQSIPALKQMSSDQYLQFHRLVLQLAKADGHVDLFEWCLYRLLLQYLAPHFDPVMPVQARYSKPEQIADAIACVLSWLAHYGHDNTVDGLSAAEKAFKSALPNGAFGPLGLELQPRTEDLQSLNKALTQLREAYPHLKARLLKTLVACAMADGEVRDIEFDLIRTLAAILETPMPDALLKQVMTAA